MRSMSMPGFPRERAGFASVTVCGAISLGAILAVSGCNSSPLASVAPGQDSVSTRLGNLLAFNSTNAPRRTA